MLTSNSMRINYNCCDKFCYSSTIYTNKGKRNECSTHSMVFGSSKEVVFGGIKTNFVLSEIAQIKTKKMTMRSNPQN
jgi:hypothetical protein